MSAPTRALPPDLNIWERDTYRVGDGEVLGAVRPGSQDHEQVPSLIGNQRSYRDGRKEAGND